MTEKNVKSQNFRKKHGTKGNVQLIDLMGECEKATSAHLSPRGRTDNDVAASIISTIRGTVTAAVVFGRKAQRFFFALFISRHKRWCKAELT